MENFTICFEYVDWKGVKKTQPIHGNIHDLSSVSRSARELMATCYIRERVDPPTFDGGEYSSENMALARLATQSWGFRLGDGISSEMQWAQLLQSCATRRANVLIDFIVPGRG